MSSDKRLPADPAGILPAPESRERYTGNGRTPRPSRETRPRRGAPKGLADLRQLADELRQTATNRSVANALVRYAIGYCKPDGSVVTTECIGAAELADFIKKITADGNVISSVRIQEPDGGSALLTR